MLPTIRRNQSWLPDIFNDFFDNSWMERTNYTAPAINVLENEKEYDVELEKKAENHEKKHNGRYLRREFSYEKFQQMLTLPEDAETDKIEAKVEHGVLNVRIPKKEKVDVQKAVKQIEIQ